jgi:hypothetical protein
MPKSCDQFFGRQFACPIESWASVVPRVEDIEARTRCGVRDGHHRREKDTGPRTVGRFFIAEFGGLQHLPQNN